MNNFCRKCGAVMTPGCVFCTECGVAAAQGSSAVAGHFPKVAPKWATFYTGFGIVSVVLGVLTPFLFAGFGYFLGSATAGYSPEGSIVSFGIGVIGSAMICGSGMILMAFGQLLSLNLNRRLSVATSKYRYIGIAFLAISAIPFLVSVTVCIGLAWQTPLASEDDIRSLIGALLLFIGFIPSAVLYVYGRTLMACEHLLNLKRNGPFPIDPAAYRGLGIAASIFGISTPVITIAFTVVAAVISPIGVIVGLFLLILGYGIIPGAMLVVGGVILLVCEQMFRQILNGTLAAETIKYRILGFASIVLGLIVPITAVVKGFAAVLVTIGAGGLIPALPPLYLGFIGCPVLIIGGVTLLASEHLLKTNRPAQTY